MTPNAATFNEWSVLPIAEYSTQLFIAQNFVTTAPLIFVYTQGGIVGGCDIVREIFQLQELQDFLVENGRRHKGRRLNNFRFSRLPEFPGII
jgi:glutaredoxin-related protein